MRISVIFAIIVLLASCSHRDNPVPTERPGQVTTPESPELSDCGMRISSPMLTMRYDEGGILFSRGDDGTVSAVRLSDECRFEFDPSTPSLRINGADIPLASATLAKENDGCQWHKLDTTNPAETIYIVTAGL